MCAFEVLVDWLVWGLLFIYFFKNLNYIVLQKYSKEDSILGRGPGLLALVSFRLVRR